MCNAIKYSVTKSVLSWKLFCCHVTWTKLTHKFQESDAFRVNDMGKIGIFYVEMNIKTTENNFIFGLFFSLVFSKVNETCISYQRSSIFLEMLPLNDLDQRGLTKWDPSNLKWGRWSICGKRGTWKTWLVKFVTHLLFNKFNTALPASQSQIY